MSYSYVLGNTAESEWRRHTDEVSRVVVQRTVHPKTCEMFQDFVAAAEVRHLANAT